MSIFTMSGYAACRQHFFGWKLFFSILFALAGSVLYAQSPPYSVRLSGFNGASANLDQARNGSFTAPVSPIDWVNGNAGASNAHYIEGFSIPYRIVMENLPTETQIKNAGGSDGKVHLILEYDIRSSDKNALDYLTHFQRLEPHNQFTNNDPTHLAEVVNPLYDPSTGITLFTGSGAIPSVKVIPEPPTPGSNPMTMPRASYNALPAGERLMSLWGGTLTDISYGPVADLAARNSTQRIYVSFIPNGGTALLAFGGHIASRLDWGQGNSASEINGSPYHVGLADWNLSNLGSQDRSLSTSAVIVFPPCDIMGPEYICLNESGPFKYSADVSSMPGVQFGYLWSLYENTAGATIVAGTETQREAYVNPGTSGGSFKVKVVITDLGTNVSSTCYLHDETGEDSEAGAFAVQVVLVSVSATSTDISCYGANDGTLTASGTGYTSLQLYKNGTEFGDPVSTSESHTFLNLSPGNYFVRAFASELSCNEDSAPETIVEPPQINISITSKDITCYGENNGSVTATGVNFTKLELYNGTTLVETVNTSGSPYHFTGLQPGNYKVIAYAPGYESEICTAESTVENITEPNQITVSITSKDITCYGESDGSVTVTGSNYTSLKLYNGATLAETVTTSTSPYTFSNLSPGIYKIVAGADGYESAQCTAESNTENVDQPNQITVSITSKDITCHGESDGSVTVTGSNYTSLKLYNGATLAETATTSTSPYTFSNLSPGVYKVVAGADGYEGAQCTAESNTENVDQPDQITISITKTDISCHGEEDGAIAASGLGYTTLKLYNGVVEKMSINTSESPYTFTGLEPGDYKVVASAGGFEGATCSVESELNTVSEPRAITVNATPQDIKCYGEASGSVTVTGSGYSYLELINQSELISTASTSSNPHTFHGLHKGYYHVEASASGNNGIDCTAASSTVFVGEPPLLTCSIQTPAFEKPVCGAHQSNTLQADITGGNGSTTYSWTIQASVSSDAANWSVYDGQGTSSIIFSAGNYPATITLTVGDGNGCSSQCTIELRGCGSEYYCTYTQGFYGNVGGKGCSAQGAQATALQMMTAVLPSGNSAYFGNGTKRFQLFGTDLTNGSIFKMLPGGKSPAALKGYATYSQVSTWPNVPIDKKGPDGGKINNILLAQTMALYFNIGQNSTFDLSGLAITGPYLVTADASDCGTKMAIPYQDIYTIIPVNVINYMNNTYPGSGGSTVGNLLALANYVLGGGTASGVTPSDVSQAVDAINRGFDGCRVFIEFLSAAPESVASRTGYVPVFAGAADIMEQQTDLNTNQSESPRVKAIAYPNPFAEKAVIEFEVAQSTHATVDVIGINGTRVARLYEGEVESGKTYRFEFSDTKGSGSIYLYRVMTPLGSQVGRLVYNGQSDK